MTDKPQSYHWKKIYTVVLIANAIYIVLFYAIMHFFA